MKQTVAVLFALALAVPTNAAKAPRTQLRSVSASSLKVLRLAEARGKGLQLLATARGGARNRVGIEAITQNRSARALVIPAAGNVPGANGTHFRSDVTFANWTDTPQNLGILWLPNGNPGGVELFTLSIPATAIVTVENFVGTALDLQGLGSIIVLPLTDDDEFDDNGAIDIYTRIWTPQPNASGTVSQPFPAVEPSFLTNEVEGVVLGLRQDAQYRTNFGIVNISEDDLTFQMSVLSEDAAAPPVRIVTVPSLSMIQQSIPAGDFGQLSLGLEVTSPPTAEFTWIAYATSTDNLTGDGWVSISANPWNDARLDEDETGQ